MTRRGWHSRGYLPHCDCSQLVQHIAFRLHDSLPRHVVRELGRIPDEEHRAFTEAALDLGYGAAHLRERAAARIVADALAFFDGLRYRLHAWCVMPNHVHVVAEPLGRYELGGIVRSWKAFTAVKINTLLGRTGRVWSPDYFDRYMRDDEQFYTTINYVEQNPVSANLCVRPEDWEFSSAFNRLKPDPDRAPSGAHVC